ncbi:MAG TPA: hypothetical protein VFR81_04105 [Longimicrobium sp.]|nr:hypothetical protein [Longimicrobium sp.]
MSKLRLDPESLHVKSFETDAGSYRDRGTVHGHSQTTATDYWTTLCGPPEPAGYPTVGCQIVPPEPVDENEKYRLPDLE